LLHNLINDNGNINTQSKGVGKKFPEGEGNGKEDRKTAKNTVK